MYIYTHTVHCAVLLCLVCWFDLACFFLPSFSSLIKTCTYIHTLFIVLCCFALFVGSTLLASFFLPSHLSLKRVYIYTHTVHCVYVSCMYNMMYCECLEHGVGIVICSVHVRSLHVDNEEGMLIWMCIHIIIYM